jgi:hypothetical protein
LSWVSGFSFCSAIYPFQLSTHPRRESCRTIDLHINV